MRRILATALALAALVPVPGRATAPTLSYEVDRIVLQRSGPLDPLPSAPCDSQAETPEGAEACTTAPGCLVSPEPALGMAYPEGPPCSLAIFIDVSGRVEGASGTVTLETLGEISSTSGLVLNESVNILYGGPFDVDVAPDGSFHATFGPIEWQTWGPGPACSHVALYFVKVHDPNEPLGTWPDDPGPGADAQRCG